MGDVITFPASSPPSLWAVPEPIARWERDALSRVSRPIEYNLTRPQRSFRYPDFALLPKGDRLRTDTVIAEILERASGVGSETFRSSHEAFAHFVSLLPGEKVRVGHLGARLPAHQHPRVCWTSFERDPETWSSWQLESLDAFVLSNPHSVDGFYYPKEFYLKLYRSLRQAAPALKIYSEESLGLAVYPALEAGSLKSQLSSDLDLFVEDSLYPVLTPAGPLCAWLHHSAFPRAAGTERLSDLEKDLCARALSCFESKNSATFAEFQRRKLAAVESVKVLSLYLNQALTSGSLSIRVWPDAGFFIVADISNLLRAEGLGSAREWCLRLAEDQRILVTPGDLFGEDQSIQICFAASSPYLDQLGPALRKALVTPQI